MPVRQNLPRWMTLRPRSAKRLLSLGFISLLITLVMYYNSDSVRPTLTQLLEKVPYDKGNQAITSPSAMHLPLRSVSSPTRPKTVLTSTEQCPNRTISLPLSRAKYFQAVERTKTFVYSAYTDGRRVRLIAVRSQIGSRTLFCQLWFKSDHSGDPLSVIQARVEDIPESHGEKNTAAYIFCQIPPARKDQLPVAVSISFSKCQLPAGNALPVQHLGTLTSTFTVCVTPLNNKYNRIHEIVEMIEFNRLLGADKIAFYNLSISPLTDKVLRHYIQRGLVEVFPWNLPVNNIHYHGQLAALNDCLYQYRNRSQYLVYEDLDEFIIPKGKLTSWAELIKQRKKHKPDAAIFQVKNVFFRREWPKTMPGFPFNEKVQKYKSVVLQTLIKEYQVLPYNHRSKYILDPLRTSTVGIHFVWDSHAPLDHIPEDDALLCHYRNWEAPEDRQKRLEDTSVVLRYGTKIIERLDKAWSSLDRELGLKPDKIIQ